MIELLIFAAAYAFLAFLLLYRLAMILYSLYSGRGIYLDIAVICAMLGIVDTMLVGRYLEKRRWTEK